MARGTPALPGRVRLEEQKGDVFILRVAVEGGDHVESGAGRVGGADGVEHTVRFEQVLLSERAVESVIGELS